MNYYGYYYPYYPYYGGGCPHCNRCPCCGKPYSYGWNYLAGGNQINTGGAGVAATAFGLTNGSNNSCLCNHNGGAG